MRPEETLQLALHAPDPGDVVVGTRQKTLTVVTPLDARDEVVRVSTIRHLVVVSEADVTQLHGGFALELVLGQVPHIDIAVPSSACGKYPFVGVPLGEQDVASVLWDHEDVMTVGLKRDLRQTKILLGPNHL